MLCCGILPAKQNPAGDPPGFPDCANFRADSSLVNVPVNVFDPLNRVVNHLDAKYFRVFEDGVEQQITAVGEDDVPASIGFVFDTSASIGAKLDLSRQAIAEFLKSANPQDEFFFLPFGSQPGAVTGFTSRSEEILDQVARARSGGTTAMLDAIRQAFLNIRKARNTRRAIVIISDGGDNHSRYSPEEVKSAIQESDVLIYAIGTFGNGMGSNYSDQYVLRMLTGQTGGRMFAAVGMSLADFADKIVIDLRNRYLLGYAPTDAARDGRHHRITVKLTPPRGLPKLQAHWRMGYYAPSE